MRELSSLGPWSCIQMNTSWPDLWDGFLISPLNTSQTCFLMCPHCEGPSAPHAATPSLFFPLPTVDLRENVNCLGWLKSLRWYCAENLTCAGWNRWIWLLKCVPGIKVKVFGLLVLAWVCKPLIARSQSRINKVNKVTGLQQKLVTYNRALALLDYHNHHPLAPEPVTRLCSQCFRLQYKCSARGWMGESNNYQFKHVYRANKPVFLIGWRCFSLLRSKSDCGGFVSVTKHWTCAQHEQ